MDQQLSSVDSLLEQAGLLTDTLKAPNTRQESSLPETGFLSSRTASVTDLDADLLGVKLDDCSRHFKKEIMVSNCLLGVQNPLIRGLWSQPHLLHCNRARQNNLCMSYCTALVHASAS